MFNSLFGKRSAETTAAAGVPGATAARATPVGLAYTSPAATTVEWLAMPYSFGADAELGSRLSQLYTEGIGERRETEFLIPWDQVYEILESPDLSQQRQSLRIPVESVARPRVSSRSAVADPDFALLLDGWLDQQGRPLSPQPKVLGAMLQGGDGDRLMPKSVWRLLNELKGFHATPVADRSRGFKEQVFGRVRALATQAGCPVSDYVARTIILTPEKLKLAMRRAEVAGELSTVEVVPGFEGAPDRWLERFDALPLQDSYDVADGADLVRVVIAPEVRQVLAEIKSMPGRRASGARAEAFVRNPFALLGESAAKVIDIQQVEEARADAGIHFERFMPFAEHGERGDVRRVVLLVQAVGQADADDAQLWFDTPSDLQRFVERLRRRLEQGSQCCFWEGHELEIEGDTPEHLIRLDGWLRAWQQPALWTAEEVFDLSKYSPRIESIGVEQPFVVPVVAKPPGTPSWFEPDVTAGLQVQNPVDGSSTLVPIRFDEVSSLQAAVARAEAAGEVGVHLPGLVQPVPVSDARDALIALAKAQAQIAAKTFDPSEPTGKLSSAKKRLVLKRNLDEIDYDEHRAAALQPPDGHAPVLPQALRPDIALKPHQMEGVAWLQHLWSLSPDQCRGTVLADDMGLGKTLQLLTFMASCFEADPTLPPALVVAPVALLENWRMELEKFFQPGAMPLLTLYGEDLKRLRVSRHQIDQELKSEGVTRLLVKNWVGDAKLVLTTYETLRDMEFAMAAQPWSVMVCDEAQKIKTPSAMVTRSAKKQKVRFRVACTGTPVENTLADLWCLFDFVQPGMLGALNHFSRTYRQPIEAKTDEQRAKVEELRTIIQPQILHRLKTDVAKDLPTPIEDAECKRLPMSEYQLGLYRAALAQLREQRETNPSAQLVTLMAMRQICSDPHGHALSHTLSIDVTRLVNESPKLGWLVKRLKALAAQPDEAHKVIVFCEFRELQLQLQRVIATFFGFAPHIVNGDTSADPRSLVNRQRLIDEFQQQPGFSVIVLSPLAVGFGVNIQAANHVIHFTRTWNPAKEDQATARAYRIGQTRTVSVCYPTVVSEEVPSFDVKLDALLSRKRALASDMLNGCGDLTAADFADL